MSCSIVTWLRLRPTLDPIAYSTLMVRGTRHTLFGDGHGDGAGDGHYLIVTHQGRRWAASGDQSYALAVVLEEEERRDAPLQKR
jgi:hypothetical protein